MKKFRYLGSAIIDLSVVLMFQRTIGSVLGLFLKMTGTNVVNDISIMVIYMLCFVGIGVLYNTLAYKYVGATLGKLFMQVRITKTDGSPLTVKEYAKREYIKYTLIVATLLFYVHYVAFVTLILNKSAFHSKRTNTIVVTD